MLLPMLQLLLLPLNLLLLANPLQPGVVPLQVTGNFKIELDPNYNKFSHLCSQERLNDRERDSNSDDDALFDEGCLLSDNNNPSNASATHYVY
jgi:hypothetical protein